MVWEDGKVVFAQKKLSPYVNMALHLRLGGRPIIPEEYAGYRSLFLEATDPRLMRLVFTEEEEEE